MTCQAGRELSSRLPRMLALTADGSNNVTVRDDPAARISGIQNLEESNDR